MGPNPSRAAAPPVLPSASGPIQAYSFGPFRLIPAERILRRGEQILPLPPKAFDTLLLLVADAGHLIPKSEFMKAVWPDSFVEEVNLANNISLLRRVLSEKGASGYIETVPKAGYRFLRSVTTIWKTSAPTASDPAPASSASPATRFIALPFRLIHGDETTDYLGRSLPEAISASLAGLRSITVRSSLLAARLAEGQPDPRRIAEEAEVDLLLAGTILCDGNDLRVTAELVQAPTATLLASFVCQTARTRIHDIQDNLVHRIAEVLTIRLTERERRTLSHDVPASARAYEFYLRANYLARERTVENLLMVRDLYRECVEVDPNFAPAWARLGRCYRFLEKFGEEGPENLELAQCISSCLRVEPRSPHRAQPLYPD